MYSQDLIEAAEALDVVLPVLNYEHFYVEGVFFQDTTLLWIGEIDECTIILMKRGDALILTSSLTEVDTSDPYHTFTQLDDGYGNFQIEAIHLEEMGLLSEDDVVRMDEYTLKQRLVNWKSERLERLKQSLSENIKQVEYLREQITKAEEELK